MGVPLLSKQIKIFLLLVSFLGVAQAHCVAAEEMTPVLRGKEVYLSYGCAVCHGKEGRGDGIIARTFDPRPTNFHDPKDYRQGTDNYHIRLAIKNGVIAKNSAMPAFKNIEDNDLQDLVNFLMSLQTKDDIK